MTDLMIGSRLRNNESGKVVVVTETTAYSVEYINAAGNRTYIAKDRIHFDGKDRHRNYNWISNPPVFDHPVTAAKEEV